MKINIQQTSVDETTFSIRTTAVRQDISSSYWSFEADSYNPFKVTFYGVNKERVYQTKL